MTSRQPSVPNLMAVIEGKRSIREAIYPPNSRIGLRQPEVVVTGVC
jgi:hypothetical protein